MLACECGRNHPLDFVLKTLDPLTSAGSSMIVECRDHEINLALPVELRWVDVARFCWMLASAIYPLLASGQKIFWRWRYFQDRLMGEIADTDGWLQKQWHRLMKRISLEK